MNASAATREHAEWRIGDARTRVVFGVEGMRCANCARSIEKAVRTVDGIEQVNVNLASARVAVDWHGESSLSRILAAVDAAGFRTVPLAGESGALEHARERRTMLKRIGVAGLGMMQTMMFVYALFAAGPEGMDPDLGQLLRVVSLLVATPVLLYSGAPFFHGAWQNLRSRMLGMDVPVAGALLLAWGASAFNTLRGTGEVYFDSVTMFIFFLLSGRYVEATVRRRSLAASEALARTLPATAARVTAEGKVERVALAALAPGDTLSIVKGAVIPVDSVVAGPAMLVDESLVTGESRPQRRAMGEALLGGSVNVGEASRVTVRTGVAGSTLNSIVALLERAQAHRPSLARMADRIASHFVLAVLVLASLTAGAWLYFDPSRAFPATLAVLVVTCPCALSLATPTVLAAATVALAKRGLLVTRADAIERLAHLDAVMLDKTGTLTLGVEEVAAVHLVERAGKALSRERATQLAAALERGSAHPLAAAFRSADDPGITVSDVREVAGAGVEGTIDGIRWRLGRGDFVMPVDSTGVAAASGIGVVARDEGLWLGDADGPVARFDVHDRVRPGVREAVDALRALGLEVVIASGDDRRAVSAVAANLGIESAQHRLTPDGKIAAIRERQQRGERVLMIGDGINDAPVLAAADVSCALGQGSALAHAASDLMLLDDSLRAVPTAVSAARRAMRVMRQNLGWALVYNLAAVPLAALGYVAPWVAAIGMSISSLTVVFNAARVARIPQTRVPEPA